MGYDGFIKALKIWCEWNSFGGTSTSQKIGQELNDVDLTSLSRRLQIVGGSEGVRILEAGQLAGSLVIVLQGAVESWRGGYKART